MSLRISPRSAILALWVIWVISWGLAAVWSDRAVKRAPSAQQFSYNIVAALGAVLLFPLHRRYPIARWRLESGAEWCLVALAAAGFAFTWWARLHLGRLWSRWVERKADHHIVQTGPYRIVRHPIYTGIGVAAIATAVFLGTLVACFGAALLTLSFSIKAGAEERFLRQELGAETYDEYARHVPMLIPFSRQ